MAIRDLLIYEIRRGFLATNLSNLIVAFVIIVAVAFGYILYQRCFHPLSVYPGPFLAYMTDLWQVGQFAQGQQPYRLTELHAQHGEIVRSGPNKLSITCEDTINVVYVKNSKTMPKTEYYNAFGQPGNPNIFNIRENEVSH